MRTSASSGYTRHNGLGGMRSGGMRRSIVTATRLTENTLLFLDIVFVTRSLSKVSFALFLGAKCLVLVVFGLVCGCCSCSSCCRSLRRCLCLCLLSISLRPPSLGAYICTAQASLCREKRRSLCALKTKEVCALKTSVAACFKYSTKCVTRRNESCHA